MDELLTGDVWREASRRLSKPAKKFAAIAYVTRATALRFTRGDVVVCDASDVAIKCGETSATVLRKLSRAGVSVYSCPGLHAKALVCGDVAVVGSANLSLSSANNLIEASILSRRFQVRSQVRAFIGQLVESSQRVDGPFLRRVSKLPVSIRWYPTAHRKKMRIVGHRTWVVSTVLLAKLRSQEKDLVAAGEKEAQNKLTNTKSDVSWIRWMGKSGFRALAKEGDSLIELSRNKRKTRCSVYQPRTILMRQDAPTWTRFYLEDPPECLDFPWRTFQRQLRKVGIHGVRVGSTRELKPREVALMETLWLTE